MADQGNYMNGDMDMGESDDDDDDDLLDDEDDEEMDDGQPPAQPEPQEEDAALARRKAIQQIMRDNTISEQEKRMRIQALMSGGRTEVAPPPASIIPRQDTNAACVHYERNCSIVAPCCDRVFGCRICHDELSPPGHPPMNRFLVREVVCKLCNTRQVTGYVWKKSAGSASAHSCNLYLTILRCVSRNQCINCQTIFGEYHCNQCNLWMSQVSHVLCGINQYLLQLSPWLIKLTLWDSRRNHFTVPSVDFAV